MGTSDFNILDKIIAHLRLGKVMQFVEKEDTVLDFGCGVQGFFLNQIKSKIKNGIGIDGDLGQNLTFDNIELQKFMFADKMPFEDKSFNKIFLLAVLEHIEPENVPSLINELKRILKDNGKIVLTIPTPKGQPIMEFLAFKLKIISEPEIRDHKKYYAKEDVQSVCELTQMNLSYHKYFQFGWNSIQVLEKNKHLN